MKLCYLDCETGNTDPKTGALLQIAGIIEINGKETGRFSYYLKPFENDIITNEALNIIKITKHQIDTDPKFQIPHNVYQTLIKGFSKYVNKYDKKDKFHLVGYNSHHFDMEFLRSFFQKCQDNILVHGFGTHH